MPTYEPIDIAGNVDCLEVDLISFTWKDKIATFGLPKGNILRILFPGDVIVRMLDEFALSTEDTPSERHGIVGHHFAYRISGDPFVDAQSLVWRETYSGDPCTTGSSLAGAAWTCSANANLSSRSNLLRPAEAASTVGGKRSLVAWTLSPLCRPPKDDDNVNHQKRRNHRPHNGLPLADTVCRQKFSPGRTAIWMKKDKHQHDDCRANPVCNRANDQFYPPAHGC